MKAEQRQAAQAATVLAYRKFRMRSFLVDERGRNYAALKAAERMGLCWWPEPNRCALTLAGVEAAAEYGGGGT